MWSWNFGQVGLIAPKFHDCIVKHAAESRSTFVNVQQSYHHQLQQLKASEKPDGLHFSKHKKITTFVALCPSCEIRKCHCSERFGQICVFKLWWICLAVAEFSESTILKTYVVWKRMLSCLELRRIISCSRFHWQGIMICYSVKLLGI